MKKIIILFVSAMIAGSCSLTDPTAPTFHFQRVQKLTASDGVALDEFGYLSISISGDNAIVGADGDNCGPDGDYFSNFAGSAYVFHWTGSGWAEQQKLTASDRAAYDMFGNSVAISGTIAIIGAPADRDNGEYSGSAYVFHWNGSSWQQQQKLTASDGAAYQSFGSSLAISGDWALAGAPGSDSVYVFQWNGSSWVQQQKLTASDGTAEFGQSVAISGDYAIVGSNQDDDKGPYAGAAYIFFWNGSSWVEQQKLTASDGAAEDFFGEHVAISGQRAVIGAMGDDDHGDFSGSAYLFEWNGSGWEEREKITAGDAAAGDQFGCSVGIDADRVIVGSDADDDYGAGSGSAYVFRWDGSIWAEEAKLTASDGATDDQFGVSVSISGARAIVGAFGDDDKGDQSGSAYLFY